MLMDGISVVVSSTPVVDCLFMARSSDGKGFFLLLPTTLNISKVSFSASELSSTCYKNWWSNSSVLFAKNSWAKVFHIYLASDFEFSDTFRIFKLRKYATLSFAWTSNITDFSINLKMSSKTTKSFFPLGFPVLLLFQWLFINCTLYTRYLWIFTEQFQDPCQSKFPVYLPILLQVTGLKF